MNKKSIQKDKKGKRATNQEEEDLVEPRFEVDKKNRVIIKNIYDRGLSENFKEMLFPRSLRSNPL